MEESLDVTIQPLIGKKNDHFPGELKQIYMGMINETRKSNDVLEIFSDGSVGRDGKAGCGVVLRDYTDSCLTVSLSEFSARLSDNVSSIHAELQAINLGLTEAIKKHKHTHIYTDSRSAIGAIMSRVPTCDAHNIIINCNNKIAAIKMRNHHVTLTWIPAHVGIRPNERADTLAKEAREKEHIDIHCPLSTRQIITSVREKRKASVLEQHTNLCERSSTFRHYIRINMETDYVYGRNVVMDTVMMRLRLGYKYYWEYGYEVDQEDRMCRVCGRNNSHTLEHYVMHCPLLKEFRNQNIESVTDQIIWMIKNYKIEEIVKKRYVFAPRT